MTGKSIYDDPIFFEKYRQFPRSVQGLSAAGEWEDFQKLMPDFTGKNVLDIGCGFGWHCFYAAEKGAKEVLGIDLSDKMLAVANEKNTFSQVSFQKMAMEDLSFPENHFDVVMSSLTLHYTPDFYKVAKAVFQMLTAKGQFVFSVEHPVFTAEGKEDWLYDEKGEILAWPVDHYFSEGKRETIFLGEKVEKYHRTLTTYLNELIAAGFTITKVVEPQPPKRLLESVPGMQDELRRPMMLLIAAEKNVEG